MGGIVGGRVSLLKKSVDTDEADHGRLSRDDADTGRTTSFDDIDSSISVNVKGSMRFGGRRDVVSHGEHL